MCSTAAGQGSSCDPDPPKQEKPPLTARIGREAFRGRVLRGQTLISRGSGWMLLSSPDPLFTKASCSVTRQSSFPRCTSSTHPKSGIIFVAEQIKQRPIAGWGLDAARRLPGGTAQVIIRHCDVTQHPDGIALSSQTLPLHPHNAILQVWLELGGVGIALGFGPLILSIWRALRIPAWRTRLAQAMIAGTTIAALSVALVSFGIWQERFLSGLFIAAAFVVLAARQCAAAAHEIIVSTARVRQI